jgi:hypothetical protein
MTMTITRRTKEMKERGKRAARTRAGNNLAAIPAATMMIIIRRTKGMEERGKRAGRTTAGRRAPNT